MSLARIDVSWSLTAVGISKAIVNNNDLSALLFPFALKNETQEVYKKLPTLALMVGEMIPFTIVRKIFM